MRARERFRETMAYGSPERPPYFEEGIRADVVEAWLRQGMPLDEARRGYAPCDRRVEIAPDLEPMPPLDRWPRTAGELAELERRLDPEDPARLPEDWEAQVAAWRRQDQVVMLRAHRGFFLSFGVRDWSRFLEVIYLLHDDPPLVEALLELQGRFAAAVAERILDQVEVDALVVSEPIGGNDRPLLGPDTYEALVLPSYRPLFELCAQRRISTVVFRTYANARVLLPAVLRAGFTCLWACEVDVEAMDYRDIRSEHGRQLRLIGGIDLDVLHRGEEAIRAELEAKVPPLLAGGGYVPLADGRVRVDVPYTSYRLYRRLLERIVSAQMAS